MELLEGETVRSLLAKGPPSPRRTVDLAVQIARGLAAAHGKGVVHRDLKPENVFVARDGHVKILDFGLARWTESAPSGEETSAPTAQKQTDPGVVMGTVGYMSPEQVKGEPVDHRSDIFSFGAVLYELLSGKQAFRRSSAVETMAAILKEDPPELDESGRNVPPGLRRIVDHCLEKSPARRFYDAQDLAFALESATGAASTGSQAAQPGETSPRAGGRPAARRALAAGVAVLLLALAALLGRWTAPRPLPPSHPRYITSSGRDTAPAISPDGRLCAFVSTRDGVSRIWLRQFADGSEVALTEGPDGVPRFSPDSASVLFVRQEAPAPALYRVSALGGSPQRLLADTIEADVSPDGSRLAFVRFRFSESGRTAELWVAGADGSGQRLLDKAEALQFRSPRWSPDGTWVAATKGEINIGSPWEVILFNPGTGVERVLPAPAGPGEVSDVAWTRDGRSLVYGRRDQAVVPASPGTYYLQDVGTGALRPIAFSLAVGRGLDVAGPGRLVVDSLSIPTNMLEVPLLDAGPSRRWLTQGSHVNFQPVVSGDGAAVAFTSNRNGTCGVWELTRRSGSLRRLTGGLANDVDVFLSRDRRSLLWSSTRTGHFEIWGAGGDGSSPHRISDDGADAENPSLSSDGSTIVYVSFNDRRRGLWTLRPDGTNARLLVPGRNVLPEISPDGAWVSFVSQGNPPAIVVVRLADGAPIFRIPAPPPGRGFIAGRHRWTPDGRGIVFLGGDGPGTALFVQDVVPGGETSTTRRRLATFEPDVELHSFGLAPDMSVAVVAIRQPTSNLLEIEGLPPEVAPAGPRGR